MIKKLALYLSIAIIIQACKNNSTHPFPVKNISITKWDSLIKEKVTLCHKHNWLGYYGVNAKLLHHDCGCPISIYSKDNIHNQRHIKLLKTLRSNTLSKYLKGKNLIITELYRKNARYRANAYLPSKNFYIYFELPDENVDTLPYYISELTRDKASSAYEDFLILQKNSLFENSIFETKKIYTKEGDTLAKMSGANIITIFTAQKESSIQMDIKKMVYW